MTQREKLLKSNEDWMKLFNSMELSPFARNYFGNMSLSSHNDKTMTFIADINIGNVPENIMSEFKIAIESKFLKKIDIEIEKGDVNNSPIQVNENKMKEEESFAKDQINNDKDIQKFIKKFNGKIKSDTIKPSK
tara:strand:+ start:170 stop:571 length:402 start_codon:yes stop_codon:yes gene_type:complete